MKKIDIPLPESPEVELLETISHGVSMHLSQALETLSQAIEFNIHGQNHELAARGRKYAISSCIHSYCAFEHTVNLLLFYKYKYNKPDNKFYVADVSRTALEKKFVSSLQKSRITVEI